MARAEALDEAQLSAILDNELRQAVAYQSSEISKEREDALKRYYGEPYGNEEEGRSQVVMRDVQEVVEWLLPALIKVFMSGDNAVEFLPRGPEDEEIAKQRTEYINYVFQQDNNGFLTLYTVFKDALIQKNGVVKVYWDEHALDEVRTVEGIDDDAYTLLVEDPDIEILEHTEYSGAMAGPRSPESGEVVGDNPGPLEAGAAPIGALPADGNAFQGAPMASPTDMMPPDAMGQSGNLSQPGYGLNSATHDVKYRKKGGKVCIEAIPPELWLVSARTIEICKSPYIADRKRKTISELIAEGFDRDLLEGLGEGNETLSGEAETRANIQDQGIGADELSDREGVMREVWVTDHYILVDYDGDGIAERRRVVTAGSTANILLNEEWEGPPPYASFSGILTPHRVIGQSIADQIEDIQLLTTTLMRQMLDNLYLTNHPRYAGTSDVNQDDWYSPNPGQLIGTGNRNPNEVLQQIVVPFAAGSTMPVLEFIATLRENRTGVTRYNQGIDANSLNKTATGISQIMTAAQQRVELMARIIAETGMKDMFKLIDHCVTKYQNKERVIRIRNNWVPVDPRQWESNFDMTINVGLGTGNKDQQLMHLQTIAAAQKEVVMLQGGANGPLVTMENIHQTMTKLTENAGFKNSEAFWTDPRQAPPPPPKPDPEMLKLEQDGKIKAAELQQKSQFQEKELMLKAAVAQSELQLKQAEASANVQMKREQGEQQQMLARDKMQGDQELKRAAASKPSIYVGQDGKAAEIMGSQDKMTEAMLQMMQSFMDAQARRDAMQDAQMNALMQMVTAPKAVERGPDGRVVGVRTVMPGNGTVQ